MTRAPDRDDMRRDRTTAQRALEVDRARLALGALGRADGPPDHPRGVVGFFKRYGWRAYALPVLVIISIVALATAGRGGGHPAAAAGPSSTPAAPAVGQAAAPSASRSVPATAAPDGQIKVDTAGPSAINQALAADALPAGGPYTMQGAGTFRVLAGTSPVVGTGPLHKYSIDVENGVSGVDLSAFAAKVVSTLSDPRSWSGHGVALQRVDTGPVDFHVTLTSSLTVRNLCGYEIQIETSCWDPGIDRVVLNVSRWVRGDAAYIGDLNTYQVYMINHEDGHALGHLHAHQCLPGGLAPVMMQQTIGLKSTTGQMCQANPWPYPPGAAGAPGAEAPDTNANNESTLENE